MKGWMDACKTESKKAGRPHQGPSLLIIPKTEVLEEKECFRKTALLLMIEGLMLEGAGVNASSSTSGMIWSISQPC